LPDSFCPVTMQRMSINAPQVPRIIYDRYLQGTGSPPHGGFRRIAA
jgi:hypothetical protein